MRRRDQMMDELDEDIRQHIDQETEDNIGRGMSPEDARFAALKKFGNVMRIREETRDIWGLVWLDQVVQDARYGLRTLRKSPGFAMVAVLTLATGIAASTVSFSILYNLLFHAFSARDANLLVVPVMRDLSVPQEILPLDSNLSEFRYLQAHNEVLDDIAGYDALGLEILKNGSHLYQLHATWVTSNAFEFYGVPALFGRGIASADGQPGSPKVFVASFKTWREELNGDPTLIGHSYIVGHEPRTLVGVMPDGFLPFSPLSEIWLPITATEEPSTSTSTDHADLTLLGRLKRNVDLKRASADFDVLVRRLASMHPDDYPKKFSASLMPASDFLLRAPPGGIVFRTDVRHLLYYLFFAAVLLLIIACSDVGMLLSARAILREREIAMRAALGAARGRIARQLLVESLLLGVTACLLGCLFSWAGTKGVESIISQRAWANIRGEAVVKLNAMVLGFALLITLLATLLCGLAPIFHVWRIDLQPQLIGAQIGTSWSRGKLRGGLIIVEVSLAVVLLISGALVLRSFRRLVHTDLGFNPKNVLVVAVGPSDKIDLASLTSAEWKSKFQAIAQQLRSLPDVESVAVNNTIPGYGPVRGPEVSSPGSHHVEEAGIAECDEYCLQTLQFHLLRGRWFSRVDVQSEDKVTVLSEKLASDLFGNGNPLGSTLRVKRFQENQEKPADADFQVIGVVADVKNAGPQNGSKPMAFIPPLLGRPVILQVKTRVPPSQLIHDIEERVWKTDPGIIFWSIEPLSDFLQRLTFATPELAAAVSTPIAAIALLLVVVGIFSLLAYNVSARTNEIGIRITLGAQRREILAMVLKAGVQLLIPGMMIGLIASYVGTSLLKSLVWGISVRDWSTFVLVATLMILVGLAACLFPAFRATRVDPLVALRYE
jgi:predicted permease